MILSLFRVPTCSLNGNIGAGVNSYFRNGNIDEFPPGIAWVNGWGEITGDLPFQNTHALYIGTGPSANGQCNIQHMIDAYSSCGSAIRYRENPGKPWSNWMDASVRPNSYIPISDLKNVAVVSTTSNCYVLHNNFMAIVNFGLFLISQHLDEDMVEIFTLPNDIVPRTAESYFTLASTDGYCAKCRVGTNGKIIMDKTPKTVAYFGGQAVIFIEWQIKL